MIYVFYFLAAVLVFLGWRSLRGGILYLQFFRTELARPPSDYAPFCSIIAPCRGLDDGLRENLAALFRQNHPRYEIVFVVDDERDAAVAVIESLMSEPPASAGGRDDSGFGTWDGELFVGQLQSQIRNPQSQIESRPLTQTLPTKLVVAGKAVGESQKVHNLRQAVTEVSDESKVFVFVDSDARPGENWLRDLTAPLQDESVGCATGYRWFVAEKFGFAAELRSVWNASAASALGANAEKNFCWGGSTAIRRATFEKLNIRERWRGALSDDFALMRVLNEAKLPIRFVPQCLTASVENCTFNELLEFTTRQMKITRVYAEHLWKASLIGSFVFSTVFWTGFGLLFFLSGVHFRLTLFFVAAIFALGAGKSFLRMKAVRLILKNYESATRRQIFTHSILWTLAPPLYFYNSLRASLSRKIRWRGIEYELKSATETVILSTNKS